MLYSPRTDRVGNMNRMCHRVLHMQRNFWPTPNHFHVLEHQYTVAHLFFRTLQTRIRPPTKRVCEKVPRCVNVESEEAVVGVFLCRSDYFFEPPPQLMILTGFQDPTSVYSVS